MRGVFHRLIGSHTHQEFDTTDNHANGNDHEGGFKEHPTGFGKGGAVGNFYEETSADDDAKDAQRYQEARLDLLFRFIFEKVHGASITLLWVFVKPAFALPSAVGCLVGLHSLVRWFVCPRVACR